MRYALLSSKLRERRSICTESASSSARRASKSPAPKVSAFAAAQPAARRTESSEVGVAAPYGREGLHLGRQAGDDAGLGAQVRVALARGDARPESAKLHQA